MITNFVNNINMKNSSAGVWGRGRCTPGFIISLHRLLMGETVCKLIINPCNSRPNLGYI